MENREIIMSNKSTKPKNIYKIDYAPTEWYTAFHSYAHGLADSFQIDFKIVAGIFSYCTPQRPFRTSMDQTFDMLRYGEVRRGLISAVQKEKLKRLYKGEDFMDLTHKASYKIRNFYQGILDPDGDSTVVDIHVTRAYLKANPKCTVIDSSRLDQVFGSKKRYFHIANWLTKQGKKRGLNALRMQSLLWTSQRGSKH